MRYLGGVTSSYHGRKISGSQRTFSSDDHFALSDDGRKVWATVLFLSESLTGHFFVFYDLLAAPPFVENQKFAIMATRRNDAQFLLFARLFIRNPDTEKKKVKIGIRKKKRHHRLDSTSKL